MDNLDHKVDGSALNGILNRAFYLALLLTRHIERAALIVEAAIEASTGDGLSEAKLLTEVARLAWDAPQRVMAPSERDVMAARSMIPVELRRVLGLPEELRYCFVLRVLAGMPANACAELMSKRLDEVDRIFELSACVLAYSPQEKSISASAGSLIAARGHSI